MVHEKLTRHLIYLFIIFIVYIFWWLLIFFNLNKQKNEFFICLGALEYLTRTHHGGTLLFLRGCDDESVCH